MQGVGLSLMPCVVYTDFYFWLADLIAKFFGQAVVDSILALALKSENTMGEFRGDTFSGGERGRLMC